MLMTHDLVQNVVPQVAATSIAVSLHLISLCGCAPIQMHTHKKRRKTDINKSALSSHAMAVHVCLT